MKKSLFLAVFFGLAIALHAQDVAFIVHPDSTDSALTGDDIKQVLLGNLTKWRRGTVIKLAVLTEGPLHTKVIRDFTQRTVEQFDKFWKRQVFTGNGVMPFQAKNEAEMLAYVAANPGAIGYIPPSAVSDGVKVLPVR